MTDTEWTREALYARIRRDTDTVLLAFSRGKDSIAAWLLLREAGFRVVPFHMEIVPRLPFVQRSLAWFERYFDTPIVRVLHPNFLHWFRTMSFQGPGRCGLISALDETGLLRVPSYTAINRAVARDAGLPEDTWVAMGTRAQDSLRRRVTLRRYGPLSPRQRTFWAIFDMTTPEQIALLRQHGIRLPIDYALFGRSFDGIDWRFLKPIHDHLPADYAVIRYWFPLVHYEFIRADLAQRGGAHDSETA